MLREQPYGKPADIWAMGVTLLELWTGVSPMKGLEEETCEDRIVDEFAPPEQLGPCWEDHKHMLDSVPVIQETLAQCFQKQNERVKATQLWQELSIFNLLHACNCNCGIVS